MNILHGAAAAAVCAAVAAWPVAALAQRAAENAVANAEDAFGSTVGLETTGIYNEADTRGFSPVKAGNARIDGLYYDPVGSLSQRMRMGSMVRVGFASEEYPFHAPTGIVDYRFRPFPTELGASVGFNVTAFGGGIRELDLRIPVLEDHLGLTGGVAHADIRYSDGSTNRSWGMAIRPIARFGGVEFAPFASINRFYHNVAHPLVVVADGHLPAVPPSRTYLGQEWAAGHYANRHFGGTVKASVTGRLSLRAGLFHAVGDRERNFAEIYALPGVDDTARHRLIADPAQDLHSTSGEIQVAWRARTGDWQHRLIAGYRGRNRFTETGGSDVVDFGTVRFGTPDRHPEPVFTFGQVNAGRVRQSAAMLGYIGKIDGLGAINLGIQRARYRATFRDGRTGVQTRTGEAAWLYNATLSLDVTDRLSVYLGSEKGLEDSGAAPENATNRNEQLHATRTTQYEAGVRWKANGLQLVVSGFQIAKPYFSFDAANTFTELGHVRHRGIEASLAGHIGRRLNVVAGGVLMQPRVTGRGRDLGLVGERPAGTPSLYSRIDVNWRTDLLGGLTPTAALVYTGRRAVSAQPRASLGGRQLFVPAFATVDLGVRHQFHVGRVPAMARFVVYNVFDAATWKVAAPNTLNPEERRRMNLMLSADF